MHGHKVGTLPEDGALYKVRFALRKDTVEIYLDTSGDGLHKARLPQKRDAGPPSRRRWPPPLPTWAACAVTPSCRTRSAAPARWSSRLPRRR